MSDPNPCKIVLDKEMAGIPVTDLERRRCQLWLLFMQILKERAWRWRIGPWPEPDPSRIRRDELTTIPSIRDLLINEVILDALKTPSFGQGLFDDLQVSDVYTEVLRSFIDELDATTKNLRAELKGLEGK